MAKVLEKFTIGNRTIKADEDLKNIFINPVDLIALKKAGKIKFEETEDVVIKQHEDEKNMSEDERKAAKEERLLVKKAAAKKA